MGNKNSSPNKGKVDPPRLLNTSLSQMKVKKFTYSWTIDNFTHYLKKSSSEQFKSGLISLEICAGEENTIKGHLMLMSNDPKGFIGLFLHLATATTTANTEQNSVIARYEFGIVNEDREVTNVKPELEGNFGKRYNGIHNFISWEELLDPENGLLPEDRLTVIANIAVVAGSKTLASAVLKEAPPCNLSEELCELLQSGDLADVTLIAEGGEEVNAHKVVLAARSTQFKAIFRHQEMSDSRVKIADVNVEVLTELIRFIYTEKVDSLENMKLELLSAADKYDLAGLKSMCEASLLAGLTYENVIATLISADLYSCNELKEKAIAFIKLHGEEVMKTDGWNSLVQQHPRLIAEICQTLLSPNVSDSPVC